MFRAKYTSGMLLLQESYTSLLKVPSPDIQFWDPTIPVADSIAKEAVRVATAFLSVRGPLPSELVSPFILHLFYCSHMIYTEKGRSTGSESALQATEVLSSGFKAMDERWKAAGQ